MRTRGTQDVTPVDPDELLTLAELAAEGLGPWDSPYTKSPRDVIEALARQLDGEVVLDDLGRLALEVSTSTACRSVLTPPGPGGHPSVGGS